MKKAPPQTPPGKHYDPRKRIAKRNVVPRMRRGLDRSFYRKAVPQVRRRMGKASPERGGVRGADGGVRSRKQTSVGVWGSGRRSRQPLAAAHPAVRPCIIREPPPASPSRQCRQMFSGQVPENRRPWPLQSMAANGRRQNPRQPESAMPILNPQGILRIRRIQEL